ncbi:ABC transporter substrate-binding protein [Cohnella terricola]|uniref:Sugar ABC transporter substrate-binding protein n=1 Tax=Cohnella terricola TaxID=1289167 RepID=A0A559J535_9BACL|nr:sugar ABC transporter substrate-binding protein [Cohnella terricola]TVX94926.1 sugar ABC transporter substrate-binding protein [Cohnella terricola]
MNYSFKNVLSAGLIAVMSASLLAACGNDKDAKPSPSGSPSASSATSADPQQKSDKPFNGQKLSIVTANHPWGDVIKTLAPQFEEKTGIKVDIQSFFEDQLTQKLTVQFTAGSKTPDVFMFRPMQDIKLFYKNGWVQAIDTYAKADEAYDFNDFSKTSISSTTVDGNLAGIPLITEQHILYYRKDLLEKAGIPVPKTMDELIAAAGKLHDPKNEVYGFVSRGQASPLVGQISSFIYSEGGEFMKDGNSIINAPEAVKGMSIYANLLKDYAPPGVLNMSWPQAIGVFAEGKAAFFADANSIYKNAIDPEKSKVADKVGYAQFPAGSAGSNPFNITSWGIAMNSQSGNKDAAWEFMKWATSKEIVLETQKKGNPGPRLSVWANPEGITAYPPELAQVTMETQKGGVDHSLPQVSNVSEARDIIGGIVQKAILGEDIQKAADQGHKEFQALIDNEKK